MMDILREMLKRHEGFSAKPYKDTVGKITIGYGRNLDDVGISIEEASLMLDNDIKIATATAKSIFIKFDLLDEARKAVVVNMAFNLGAIRLHQFSKMIAAVHVGDFAEAAKQMLDSKWAHQVGKRAVELAAMMDKGA